MYTTIVVVHSIFFYHVRHYYELVIAFIEINHDKRNTFVYQAVKGVLVMANPGCQFNYIWNILKV